MTRAPRESAALPGLTGVMVQGGLFKWTCARSAPFKPAAGAEKFGRFSLRFNTKTIAVAVRRTPAHTHRTPLSVRVSLSRSLSPSPSLSHDTTSGFKNLSSVLSVPPPAAAAAVVGARAACAAPRAAGRGATRTRARTSRASPSPSPLGLSEDFRKSTLLAGKIAENIPSWARIKVVRLLVRDRRLGSAWTLVFLCTWSACRSARRAPYLF